METPKLPKPQPTAADYLAAIERHMRNTEQHLRSIRNMLTFFVILVLLAIVLQACSAFMAL